MAFPGTTPSASARLFTLGSTATNNSSTASRSHESCPVALLSLRPRSSFASSSRPTIFLISVESSGAIFRPSFLHSSYSSEIWWCFRLRSAMMLEVRCPPVAFQRQLDCLYVHEVHRCRKRLVGFVQHICCLFDTTSETEKRDCVVRPSSLPYRFEVSRERLWLYMTRRREVQRGRESGGPRAAVP